MIDPTIDYPVYESRLRDRFVLFLGSIARDLDSKSEETDGFRIILCHFAETLGRFLMEAPLWVLWTNGREHIPVFCKEIGGNAQVTDIESDFISKLLSSPITMQDYVPLSIGYLSMTEQKKDSICLSLITAKGESEEKLWIVLDCLGDIPPIWKYFKEHIPGLKFITFSLNALLKTQKIENERNRIQQITYEADSLLNSRNLSVKKRLESSVKLLKQIVEVKPVRLIKQAVDICLSNLQILLRSNWTDHSDNKDGKQAEPDEKTNLVKEMTGYAKEIHKSAKNYDNNLYQLKNVINCFYILLNLEPHIEVNDSPVHNKDILLPVLMHWIQMYKLYRPLCQLSAEPSELVENMWNNTVSMTVEYLSDYLEKTGNQIFQEEKKSTSDNLGKEMSEDKTSAGTLNFLYLWFCLMLLYEEKKNMESKTDVHPGLLKGEKIAFRADLAYILREAVQFACFGHRNDYTGEPRQFLTALITLVEYHAHWIVGLPTEYNIRLLFHIIIGDMSRKNFYWAEEHLRHILEVYLAGFFLIWFHVEKKDQQEQSLTVLDILASASELKPGEQRKKEFKCSYCLAALYHDIGHLLFPIELSTGKDLYPEDAKLKMGLTNVKNELKEAGTVISRRSVEDLKSGNYFEPGSESQLDQWLNTQIKTGEPDHGLLSAWYLHHVCSSVQESSQEIVRKAVRSILLHNAFTVRIDAEKDPLASLLVLCDELFEWEQIRHIKPPHSSADRFFHIMNAKNTPFGPRYRRIGCYIHKFSISEKQLAGTLKTENNETWPDVFIITQDSQYMNISAFALWLMKAQNLGRIKPGKNGWGPSLLMKGRDDMFHWQQGTGTKKLLELIAQHSQLPIRPDIARWVTNKNVFEDGKEEVRLGYLDPPLCQEDIRSWLTELEAEAIQLLREFSSSMALREFS